MSEGASTEVSLDVAEDRPSAPQLRAILNQLTNAEWEQALGQGSPLPVLMGLKPRRARPAAARQWVSAKDTKSDLFFVLVAYANIAWKQYQAHDEDQHYLPTTEPREDEVDAFIEWAASTLGAGPAIVSILGICCRYGRGSRTFARRSELPEVARATPLQSSETVIEVLDEEETLRGAGASPDELSTAGDSDINGQDATSYDAAGEGDPGSATKSAFGEGEDSGLTQLQFQPEARPDDTARSLEDQLLDAIARAQSARTSAISAVKRAALQLQSGCAVDQSDHSSILDWNDALASASSAVADASGLPPLDDLELISRQADQWIQEQAAARLAHEERQRARMTQARVKELQQALDSAAEISASLDLNYLQASGVLRDSLARPRELAAAEVARIQAELNELVDQYEHPLDATASSVDVTPDNGGIPPEDTSSVISRIETPHSAGAHPSVESLESPPAETASTSETKEPAASGLGTSSLGSVEIETDIDPSRVDESDGPQHTSSSETVRGDLSEPLPSHSSSHASAIASLLSEFRPGAAYWVAVAASCTSQLVEALRFAAAAFATGSNAIDAGALLSDARTILDPVDMLEDPEACLVAAAAVARAGLLAGWIPDEALIDDLGRAARVDPSGMRLLNASLDAIRLRCVIAPSLDADDRAAAAKSLASEASQLMAQLEHRSVKYQRATLVLQHLARPTEPLGQALTAAREGLLGNASKARETSDWLSQLSDDDYVEKLIDETDVSIRGKRARDPIRYRARERLIDHIKEVVSILLRADALMSASTETSTVNRDEALSETLRAARDLKRVTDPSPGQAALDALADWILRQPPPVEPGQTRDEVLRRAILPAWFVPRDEAGEVSETTDIDPSALNSVLQSTSTPLEWAEGYTREGNLELARYCRAIAGLDTNVDELPEQLEQELLEAKREASRHFDTLRSMVGVLSDQQIADVQATLLNIEGTDPLRLDLALRRAHAVRTRLAAAVGQEQERLLARLSTIAHPTPESVAKVRAVIDEGNLITASEMIDALAQGGSLPQAPPSDDEHVKQLRDVLQKVPQNASANDAAQVAGGIGSQPDRARIGLEAWSNILATNFWRDETTWSSTIRDALRLLGLDVPAPAESIIDATPPAKRRSGYRVLRVKAEPDRSIVPALGSRTHQRYNLVVMTERRSNAGQILDTIDESQSQGPNLILFPWLMSLQDRRNLLLECRRRRITALLIDNAVAGIMAARSPGSFADLQRLTLPFSVFQHYVPFVAGNVPPEVFVGRQRELEDVLNQYGSLFVYGGRQLGKSALLRRAQQIFHDGEERVAIYLDLQSHGIGTYRDPDALWSLVADELKSLGIIKPNVSSPSTIGKEILAWLDGDPARRMILLLDEADRFLDSEAKETGDGKSSGKFRVVGALKVIMEQSHRRFKPVFSGLHQVQRFQSISNTPLAHGGKDIPIGPLPQAEAYELLKPLGYLGYSFDPPELALRILTLANYQANLIQIVCDALVERMQSRRLMKGEPPFAVTEDDTEAMFNDAGLQSIIASRFELTMNLEDRYKVIALTCAVRALNTNFREEYEPAELLRDCSYFWPEGFEGMDLRDFSRYLVEMQVLGVFANNDEGQLIRFRSPQVVRMLGDEGKIERELLDGRDTFDLPKDYNPSFTRRRLPGGRADRRSPLTEEQLGRLVPAGDAASESLRVIFGSSALGIDSVAGVLTEYARENQRGTLRVVKPADWDAFEAEWRDLPPKEQRELVPIVELFDDTPDFRDVVKRAALHAGHSRGAVYLVAGPAGWDHLSDSMKQLAERLQHWSDEGLRSWEHDFDSKPYRRRLRKATGGWHSLVTRNVAEARATGDAHRVLEEAELFPATRQSAESFLESAGVPPGEVRHAVQNWALQGADEAWPEEFLPELLGVSWELSKAYTERLTALGVIERINGSDESVEFTIDPVVARCLDIINAI